MYPKTDELKEVLNENIALYIISILKKSLGDDWTYANKMTRAKVLDLEIKLPVTEVEEPDWVYMHQYIKELEHKYIKELEQYLITTGLDDYTLTDEDVEVLGR